MDRGHQSKYMQKSRLFEVHTIISAKKIPKVYRGTRAVSATTCAQVPTDKLRRDRNILGH